MFQTACRALYALTVVALIGSTAWAASGIKSERQHSAGRVGIVLLAALQR
jgi:hypothetical protein